MGVLVPVHGVMVRVRVPAPAPVVVEVNVHLATGPPSVAFAIAEVVESGSHVLERVEEAHNPFSRHDTPSPCMTARPFASFLWR